MSPFITAARLEQCLITVLGYGAEVYWDVFKPAPKMIFMNPLGERSYPKHSHLLIQTEAGETFHFDCTGEQFGWSGADWLTEPREFTKRMADMLEETEDGATSYKLVRWQLRAQDQGYWRRIFASFDKLFGDLVWKSMSSGKAELVERLLREKAEKLAEAAACATWGPKPRH